MQDENQLLENMLRTLLQELVVCSFLNNYRHNCDFLFLFLFVELRDLAFVFAAVFCCTVGGGNYAVWEVN